LESEAVIEPSEISPSFVTWDEFETLRAEIESLKSDAQLAEVPPSPPPPKKYPDWRMTGFFQLDSARFHQSDANLATLGDIQDGTGFRRVRLAATGNITQRSTFLMEFDAAQGQARFVDVWGQANDTPFGNLRVGRFRQPFGMSDLTSARDLPFLERPSLFALSPFRQTGIMLFDTALSEQMTWAVSGFRTISDNFGNVYGDDGGYGTAARLTALLVDHGDDAVLHVGLDYSFLDPARDQILIASQDEVFVGQNPTLGPGGLSVLPIVNVPPFVNSGVLNVNHLNLFNVEAAASLGRSLVQAEYRWSDLELIDGDNVTVHGGYVTTRYMLTGETIPYNRTAGVFGGVTPRCPLDACRGQWGAWELAGRVSTIDLNPLFGAAGVTGPTRRLNSTSLALNWYWWVGTKAQFEWIHGRLNDPVSGDSTANTFASRIQFAF
jgi:phosphate-selective porin OprO/OprP